MKFKKGDIVYKIPIRFWEDRNPTKCIIAEDGNLDVNFHVKDSIFIYSEEYGHNVWIDRKDIFFSIDNAKKAIELYTQLDKLYSEDECEKIFEVINIK